MIPRLFVLALAIARFSSPVLGESPHVWVEAESFQDRGGWKVDTQFIGIMGSPYLLAHGLGSPVADATTTVQVPAEGKYRVWVRTKDWVAPWQAKGSPGRFQMTVAGQPLGKDFGDEGTDWTWEDGGVVDVGGGLAAKLELHDLTGLEGRVDAILLTRDLEFEPPVELAAVNALRREASGLPEVPPETAEYDLVVIGGGYAGLASAISAARQGIQVALIQDRPVLGGNGSSEIQVWAQGGTRRGLYPHLGEIVEEFADRASNSPAADPAEFNDALKEQVARAEKNLDLFLNTYVYRVEMDGKNHLRSVTGLDTMKGTETRFRGRFFADCTGHGNVGALAGAEFLQEEKGRMGMSNMWVIKKTADPKPWPETPWALPLEMGDFPEPRPMEPYGVKNKSNLTGYDPGYVPAEDIHDYRHGEWFWESGFDQDPIQGLERIRDWNFRAVYGAISTLKRSAPETYKDYDFVWMAYIGGPRESRRLLGDVILQGQEMVDGKIYDDACVPTTWDQDLHYPKEQYAGKFPDNPFISRAEFGKHTDRKNGYPVPYRCLYSKDIDNLFMAGRCISVDRWALGSIRVMRTCGMFGEVVGKAAWICVRHHTTPRGVYDQYLDILKNLMTEPGAMRRDSLEGDLYLPADAKALPPVVQDTINPASLEGIVIDEEDADLTGKWASGEGLRPYVGQHYQYSRAPGASARFAFAVKETGRYDVLVFWQPHANRATNTPVSVLSAEGEKSLTVNQTQPAGTPNGAHRLGTFTFNAGEEAAVVFRTEGADGNVHIDAVQIVPAP
ncbi:MAG: FAD-dependent oxidoreductase [Verrucomicrobiales bacterium]|nr:FAD-dependent oxidoreductase [Verrucomicrobiales bacterium]